MKTGMCTFRGLFKEDRQMEDSIFTAFDIPDVSEK